VRIDRRRAEEWHHERLQAKLQGDSNCDAHHQHHSTAAWSRKAEGLQRRLRNLRPAQHQKSADERSGHAPRKDHDNRGQAKAAEASQPLGRVVRLCGFHTLRDQLRRLSRRSVISQSIRENKAFHSIEFGQGVRGKAALTKLSAKASYGRQRH